MNLNNKILMQPPSPMSSLGNISRKIAAEKRRNRERKKNNNVFKNKRAGERENSIEREVVFSVLIINE